MCMSIPGQIVEIIDVTQRRAQVDVVGVRREVSIALMDGDGDGARIGDWVLVHVGYAVSRIDEDEARERLAALRHINDMYDQMSGVSDHGG